MKIELNSNYSSSPNSEKTTTLKALKNLRRAAYTLWVPPPFECIQTEVADVTHTEFQPLHPSIEETLHDISQRIEPKVGNVSRLPKLSRAELIQMAGVLIQFTDHVPQLQSFAQTLYAHVYLLYKEFVEHSVNKSVRLNYVDQLEIALKQTGGDLPEALWRLFIASRLFARWLDSKSVVDVPNYTRSEKVEIMVNWQRSLCGCKDIYQCSQQDASGDTYYTWTHALAKIVYIELPARKGLSTKLATKVFQNGTDIMQTYVHKITPQSVYSDHTLAAEYGNAIGTACINLLTKKC